LSLTSSAIISIIYKFGVGVGVGVGLGVGLIKIQFPFYKFAKSAIELGIYDKQSDNNFSIFLLFFSLFIYK